MRPVYAYEAKAEKKYPYPSRPAPQLTGDEWEEDEECLKKMYPRLFAKFCNEDSGGGQRPQDIPGGMDAAGVFEALKKIAGLGGGSDAESLYAEAVFGALDETPENLKKSAALLAQAAELGHVGAQYLLGNCYDIGSTGVAQSYGWRRLSRYRKAAEQENGDACSAIGTLYQQGNGVPQDDAQALEWLRVKELKRARRIVSDGLAILYANGLGVKEDRKEAFKWFNRAAQGRQ